MSGRARDAIACTVCKLQSRVSNPEQRLEWLNVRRRRHTCSGGPTRAVLMDTEVEHTLFVCREVSAFQIPPRPAAGGHRSGDWKVADKVFTGRLRVVAKAQNCELRLEESNRYTEQCSSVVSIIHSLVADSLCAVQRVLVCYVPSGARSAPNRCGASSRQLTQLRAAPGGQHHREACLCGP